jgi:hypothetical protein
MPAIARIDHRVDMIIKGMGKEQAAVARALRATIRSCAPQLVETVKWNNPCYTLGRNVVVGLMVYPRAVHLSVWRGTELSVKFPQIVGTGKSLRHVAVADAKEARSQKVVEVINAAVALELSSISP